METKKERIVYMDILKAFAIIAVVVGHSGFPCSNIIYLYHVPLFFIISGYFYKDIYSKTPFDLIKKRVKTLYVPFVGFGLIFLMLHNVFFKLNIYNDKVGYNGIVSHLYTPTEFMTNALKVLAFRGVEQLVGAFWFVLVLFTVNILFVFISYITMKYIKENTEHFRFFVISLFFVIGNVATYYEFNLHYSLNTSFVALLIYYIGYLYRKYENQISYNIYFFITSVLFLVVSSLYGSVNMVNNSYLSPTFLIINSIAGAYANIYIAKIIASKRINYSILDYIGKNTFNIMALHFLSFKLINLIQVKLYNLPSYMLAKFPIIDGSHGWWVLYCLCGIFIPVIVVYVIETLYKNLDVINGEYKGV